MACASFVESGSDLYTQNLVDFFRGDDEVTAWLTHQWEAEELQHGRALRAYVSHVWPEFDWEGAYRSFLEEYATYCKVELLAPTRGLELAARCVIETGTASYYRALARSTTEPVLRDLASRIAADEVSHYKHFYRFFRATGNRKGWAASACWAPSAGARWNSRARTPTAPSATWCAPAPPGGPPIRPTSSS